MRLQVGGVDHQRVGSWPLLRQFKQHPREDALVTPALPPIVERLVRALFNRRVTPTQPIAIYEDNPAQNPAVIDPRLAVRLRKIGLQTRHLRLAQPEKIRHDTAPFWSRESRSTPEINGSRP